MAEKKQPQPFVLKNISFQYEDQPHPLFNGLTLTGEKGVTTLVGQNGTGKTTLLLLASGRLLPSSGEVLLWGENTRDLTDETQLNQLASMLYQNMEFETEGSTGELLEYVRAQGYHDQRGTDPRGTLLKELIQVLELEKCLSRPLHKISKGEIQRAVLAFSLLYGSRAVMMDEPVFAMEPKQKEKALEYLVHYGKTTDTAVFHSVHELHLAQKYADKALLFAKDGTIIAGTREEVLTQERIEEAYQLPLTMLHQKENLYRDRLLELSLAEKAAAEAAQEKPE